MLETQLEATRPWKSLTKSTRFIEATMNCTHQTQRPSNGIKIVQHPHTLLKILQLWNFISRWWLHGAYFKRFICIRHLAEDKGLVTWVYKNIFRMKKMWSKAGSNSQYATVRLDHSCSGATPLSIWVFPDLLSPLVLIWHTDFLLPE